MTSPVLRVHEDLEARSAIRAGAAQVRLGDVEHRLVESGRADRWVDLE